MHACSTDRCNTCPGRVVCRCLQVTEDEIVTMISVLSLRTVKEVRDVTGAGDGCTCCHDEIRQHLQSAASQLAVAG